ncbi:MAG: DUF1722 domain-containing protein [bacterium]|nr:MAG: DUF1722 domain-containing protein [bacterium]
MADRKGRTFEKPRVVVSRCLEFESCRYNGLMISSDVVKGLVPFVEFLPVCPEVEIGLGVPRPPIRVIRKGQGLRLVQPETKRDITIAMVRFAGEFLDSVGEVDGFILKSRSPSCGIKEVKVYPGPEAVSPAAKKSGFFGAAVIERFFFLPIEDEGRLTNFTIRENFLTRIFTFAAFRRVKASMRMRDLVAFQAENKFLLMAYNQKELRELGRIVANLDKKPIADVLYSYEDHLRSAFARAPRFTSNINVLMHALGFFSDELLAGEKAFFLDALEQYRTGRIPLSAVTAITRSWIVRFSTDYLVNQTFFEPYPAELVKITDSGKGRKL